MAFTCANIIGARGIKAEAGCPAASAGGLRLRSSSALRSPRQQTANNNRAVRAAAGRFPTGESVRRRMAEAPNASVSESERVSNGSDNSEMACSTLDEAVAALKRGEPVCVLDASDREGETDMFFPATSIHAPDLRQLRTQAGGELYIAVGHEVAEAFGLPFAGDALSAAADTYPVLTGMSKMNGAMCQGTCSVGLSIDHRATHTGAPDNERSYTCRRLAELAQEAVAAGPENVKANAAALGEEFHVPGHIFMCTEHSGGLAARQGHTELAVALARAAGLTTVMVGCVMLSNEGDDYGALSPAHANEWARANGVPHLEGNRIVESLIKMSTL